MILSIQTIEALPENIFSSDHKKNSQEIEEYLLIASQFYESDTPNYDSAFVYLSKALDKAEAQKNDLYTYIIYDTFADILRKNQNQSLAVDYYFKMLQMLDDIPNNENNPDVQFQYSLLYRYIGVCMSTGEIDKAIAYFQKSLEKLEKVKTKEPNYPDLDKSILYVYNNIESASIAKGDYSTAAHYCDIALKYPVKIDNPAYYASLYNNMGVVKWEEQKYDEAFDCYRRVLKIREESGDLTEIATTYYNLGMCYSLQKDSNQAMDTYKQALSISQLTSNLPIEMKTSGELAKLYISQKDYKKASEMLTLANILKDSISNLEKSNDIHRVEMQYLLEKQLQENELKQEMLLAKKEQKILISVLVTIAFFFLLLIVFLLYNNQRIKNKKNTLEQESLAFQNENLELKNQQLKQTLESKTKELNTHMQYLLKRNEHVTSIIENVSDLKKQEKGDVQSLIKDIKGNIESSVWNEFSLLFQDLHQDFYQELYKAHPNLTPNEKKLCAFIRLNMSTKDISSITLQSLPTIEIARSRLRKKLNLERGDNLTMYLSKF